MLAHLSLSLSIITLAVGAFGLWVLREQRACRTVRHWCQLTAWLSLAFSLVFSACVFTGNLPPANDGLFSALFQRWHLQGVLIPYILLMGILVQRFSYQYLQADGDYTQFFLKLKVLVVSLLLFVLANHSVVLFSAWAISGWVLCQLIGHTKTTAAVHSKQHAWHTFLMGDGFMLVGLVILWQVFASPYITDWLATTPQPSWLLGVGLACVVVSGFTKTANIPFAKWLPHTLTAPTPVSAIMHAGFVNSGAILFAKLAPVLVQFPMIMAGILVVGLVSALWGSVAMMVQTDVKRYLTFSTIGQMGFMMMECGLGAFHLAIGHLIIHGLFKSRLFLASGSVVGQLQAIRNTQHRIVHQWQDKPAAVLAAVVGLTAVAFGLVSLVPAIQQLLVELPPLLLVVLVLSVGFTQLALVRTKGVRLFGMSVALTFALILLLGYVAYEGAAVQLFPGLHYTHLFANASWQWGVTIMFSGLGLVALVLSSKLVGLPKRFQDWWYIALLNASGHFPQSTTFAHRSQS